MKLEDLKDLPEVHARYSAARPNSLLAMLAYPHYLRYTLPGIKAALHIDQVIEDPDDAFVTFVLSGEEHDGCKVFAIVHPDELKVYIETDEIFP